MEKIKQFIESEKGKNILVIIIVILVGISSFELGRLSKANSGSGIKIEYPNQALSVADSQTAGVIKAVEPISNTSQTIQSSNSLSGKNFFASSRGAKYYTIGCSAGKTIKPENRVYFSTSSEAEAAGYALSSSCK
ncbi:MAG: hypothetical protein KGL67_02070 [Patescibacteria group bacterium]|nr:hypothetical protein [Patescibacteria group bacterium]